MSGEKFYERTRKALDDLVYLPSLKDRDAQLQADEHAFQAQLFSPTGTSPSKHTVQCRPWERSDLFRRLHTFKPYSWFCKPKVAGPMACASRGWINFGMDLIACELCGAKLSFPIPSGIPPSEVEELAAKFAVRLDDGHESTCPWRGNACDPRLAQFPPLSRQVVESEFRERCQALSQLNSLPPIAESAYQCIQATHRTRLDELLERGPQAEASAMLLAGTAESPDKSRSPPRRRATFHEDVPEPGLTYLAGPGDPEFERRQRFLALCGWNTRVLPRGGGEGGRPVTGARDATLYCTLCGAKAPLWLYIPETMAGGPPARPKSARASLAVLTALTNTIGGAPLLLEGEAASPWQAHSGSFGSAGATTPVFGGASSRSQGPPVFGGASSRSEGPAFGGTPSSTGVSQRSQGYAGTPKGTPVCATPGPRPPPFSASPATQRRVFGTTEKPTPVFGVDALKGKPSPASGANRTPLPPLKRQWGTPGSSGRSSSLGTGSATKRMRMDSQEGEPLNKSAAGNEPSVQKGPTALQPIDPIKQHRPFCPWVSCGEEEGKAPSEGRCGWRWCLEVLVPKTAHDEQGDAAAGEPVFNPSATLHQLLTAIWK